jgi:DNA-binding NtrC family response regulator
MKDPLNVLIVDDETELRKSLGTTLPQSLPEISFHIDEAENGLVALQKTKQKNYDLVFMDVRMPEVDGLKALEEIKSNDPSTMVVIMTAHANLEDAKVAIREGAYDYLEKPVRTEQLVSLVRKSLEARKLIADLTVSNPILDDDVESEFVGHTKKMKEVFALIYRLCKIDTTVLIRGENGTGKELVARAIHFNSPKKDGPFVAINCGALPESLIESELFGHEKGSFTGAHERKIGKFQQANQGTLFLDEIGELKPEMQVKLLRVLQEKKFTPIGSPREMKSSARIIAATNRNLEKMMEDGQFREDLFYRLNVMPIFLPPLRERIEDLPDLVHHFIKRFSAKHGTSIHGIEPEAIHLLSLHRWPGNIRELENIIERAFIVENSNIISSSSLPENIRDLRLQKSQFSNTSSSSPSSISRNYLDFDTYKEEMEKEFIIQALKAHQGRINQTVAHANIPKNTLLRKIRKYGINPRDYGSEGSD